MVDIRNTEINNVERHAGTAVAREVAKYRSGAVVFFRWGSDALSPTSGGFSAGDSDFVMMPGFRNTRVCGNQIIILLAHELGHYFGLQTTPSSRSSIMNTKPHSTFVSTATTQPPSTATGSVTPCLIRP